MEKRVGNIEERAQQLKKKRPEYGAVLDFYVKVRMLQDASRAALPQEILEFKREEPGRRIAEDSSLIQKKDFPVALEAAVNLFQSLCKIGRTANSHFAIEVEKIQQASKNKKLDLKKLISSQREEQSIRQVAVELGLDRHVLLFLVQNSVRPSIEAGREELGNEFEMERWTQCKCPVCSSQPKLSLLKGEGGMRYSLCSFCGFEWRIKRLSCAFCDNAEQGFMEYFHGEGEEAHRIDLCNKCNHFIKTIDCRVLDAPDPHLEDLATLHLNVLAVEKGYKSPASDFLGGI